MYIFNKLPKGAILTGLSALHLYGFATFKPTKPTIAVHHTFKSTTLVNFSVSKQTDKTLNHFVTEYKTYKVYTLERLFVEFDLFDIENTVASYSYKLLLERIDPIKVREVYFFLIQNGRRGINKQRVEKYLDENIIDYIDILSHNKDKVHAFLREHVMLELSKTIQSFTIKGGSAIELYLPFARATEDIDAHMSDDDIQEAINILMHNESGIKYKVLLVKNSDDIEITESNMSIIKNEDKKILKFKLYPVFDFIEFEQMFKDVFILLSFNRTYTKDELTSIIKENKLSKQPLKIIKGKSVLLFSVEMLLAEKIQTLIKISENTQRTKDLLDIFTLTNEDTNINSKKILDWLVKKWSTDRNAMSQDEALKFIEKNYLNDFPKIKDNFDKARGMYDLTINYDDSIKRYRELCVEILKASKENNRN